MVSSKSPQELIGDVKKLEGNVGERDFCITLAGMFIEFNEVVEYRGERSTPLNDFDLRIQFSNALSRKGVHCLAQYTQDEILRQARGSTHFPMHRAADQFAHGQTLTDDVLEELQQLCDVLSAER